jgi:hypothetical protein
MPARTGAVLLALLMLAACGGSGTSSDPTTSSTPATTTAGPTPCAETADGPVPLCAPVNDGGTVDLTDQGTAVELTVEAGPGLLFSPTYVKVAPGAEVTVTVKSLQKQGDFAGDHSFSIRSPEVSEVVLPGETRTVTFELPEGEPYVAFYCAIGGSQGHEPAGMRGAFYFD